MRNLYIFDCFGVIISEVSSLFTDKYLNDEQKKYMRSVVFRNLDKGVITMDDMFVTLAELSNVSVEQAKREWASYECLFADTVDVIKQLKAQGHCIALLSNAATSYIDYLFNKYGLFELFDKVFVSAAYGYAKPDCEFYKLCVDSFTEQFNNIYFTDDNPNNLKDLERFGITPILFKGASDLVQKLGV